MGGETGSKVVPNTSSYPKLATRPVGQQIESIYTDRLRQFTAGGQYSRQNLVAYILPFLQYPLFANLSLQETT